MVSIDSLAGLLKPKLSKFTPHSPFAKQLAFLMLPHDEALYGGALGGGKVLYNDGEILTPFGFMKGSDLKVGQNVCNPDGSVCQIIQLHPEQNFKVWKVTFDDGTSTEVSKEHLWNAWAIGKSTKRCGKRLTGPNSAKVYETQELKKLIESGKRVRIPLCQPQKFNLPTKGKLIDPYVFGAWLGDGHTCINGSVGFTTSDKEHFSKYMVGGTWHKTNTADGWRWTGDSRKFWLKFLKQNSLDKAKSHSKFIPDKYKYSTLETRTNLLKGLMDTDGYIDKRGQCYYTSVSKQLAEDVAFVARSLGCYVKISIKKTTHKDAYELYIKHPKNICLFNLPRKIKRVKAKQFEPSKKIVSIEVLNKTKRGRCITVNHTNGLYITNDFIVTHNSDALLMAALQHVEVPGYSAMLLRKTLTDLKQSGALLDRMTNWMMPWLRTKEVRYEASTHKFYFPTYNSEGKRMIDSTIQFGYIGESNAYTRYQGIELNFCVHPDTKVLMGDGTTKVIKEIQVGDKVKTLSGNKKVIRTHQTVKPAVVLVTPNGWQIQSTTHRMLSLPAQMNADISKQTSSSSISFLPYSQRCRIEAYLSFQYQDLLHISSQWQSFQSLCLLEKIVGTSHKYQEIYYEGSDDLLQVQQQHEKQIYVSQEHLQHAQHPTVSNCYRRRETFYAPSQLQGISCLADYLEDYDQYDEFRNHLESKHQVHLPLSSHAIELTVLLPCRETEHNHRGLTPVLHPYTGVQIGQFDLESFSSCVVPLGTKMEMCDLTVEGDSHYITVGYHNQPLCVNVNCGFDEVTQHAKRDYEYLFTRLRKCVCPLHTERDANEDPIYHDDCESCQWAKSVPIRMRSTCNPDGIGFAWVKKRFEIGPDVSEEKAQEEGRDVRWIGHNKLRPFIPSTYKDNPFLDHKAYEKRLKKKLSDDLYEALVKGSWGVVANARFKKRWQRYYSRQGKILYMGPNFQGRILNFEDDIQDIFATVDSAATSDEGLGDVELYPNRIKNPSYTVICTWALTKCYNLLLLNMVRFRDEIPEVIAEVINQYQQWNPSVMIIEDNGVGKGVAQSVERAGVTVKGLFKDKDKVVNATEAILQMKNGRVWFPHPQPSWMSDFEDEVFTWQGHPQETDDIVDNLAHACNYVKWENAGQPHDYTSMIIQEMSEVPRAFFSPNRMIADGHQSSSSIIRWDH
jgi:predicted phage terminase large subunit-like protein